MGSILRLVDSNDDGQADEYTVFATLDSPRGAVFDGDTLYVSHPPFVTALRDTNGDGIAEDRRTLVRGLGFGLDFRGADHTTNGIEPGIDGWLYVAVGDYGAVKAVGHRRPAKSRCAAAATCVSAPTGPSSKSTRAARATTTTSRSIRR